jgi:hypothetical protein
VISDAAGEHQRLDLKGALLLPAARAVRNDLLQGSRPVTRHAIAAGLRRAGKPHRPVDDTRP